MKFLLDEDLPPLAAEISASLGLDATSVHDTGRLGLSDEEQLRHAAREGRIFVTRNRNDYIALTLAFHRVGEAHAGVLIAGRKLPNNRPELLARALEEWAASKRYAPDAFGSYVIDFL